MTVLIAMSLLAVPNVLFVGNSHTSTGGVPEFVQQLLATAKPALRIKMQIVGVSLLSQGPGSPSVMREIQSGYWDVVVLQGATVSSSHKYKYDQSGAVQLGLLAKKTGAKVYYFSEWPRRGWNETDFILDVYNQISAKVPGSSVIEVGRTCDALLKVSPSLNLWAEDGNHASSLGAFAASCTIARTLAPNSILTWHPKAVDDRTARLVLDLVN